MNIMMYTILGVIIGLILAFISRRLVKPRQNNDIPAETNNMIAELISKMDIYGIIHDQDLNIVFSTDRVRELAEQSNVASFDNADSFFNAFHAICQKNEQIGQTYDHLKKDHSINYQEEIDGLKGKKYQRITRVIDNGNGHYYRQWTIRDLTDFVKDDAEKLYVTEQFELQAKENAHLAEELFDAREELIKQGKELERLANTDPLTGLRNRRSFMANVNDLLGKMNEQSSLYVMMFDIDHFKNVNDTFGHATGDHCICSLAKTLMETAPKKAILSRMGGEEFALVIEEDKRQAVKDLAETIRKRIEDTAIMFEGNRIRMTSSIGISKYSHTEKSIDQALDRSDQGLYIAKNAGRNQVAFQD